MHHAFFFLNLKSHVKNHVTNKMRSEWILLKEFSRMCHVIYTVNISTKIKSKMLHLLEIIPYQQASTQTWLENVYSSVKYSFGKFYRNINSPGEQTNSACGQVQSRCLKTVRISSHHLEQINIASRHL